MKYTIDFQLIWHLFVLALVISAAILIARFIFSRWRDFIYYLGRGKRMERSIEEINKNLHGEPYPYRMHNKPIEFRILDLEEAVKKLNKQQQPAKYKTRKA